MKINHIAMYVLDLEKSKEFYMRYFGGTPNKMYYNAKTGLRTYFITFDGDVRLEIMTKPDNKNSNKSENMTGFAHLSFSVGSREKVDELTKRIERDGYMVIGSPRTTGDGYYESVVLDNEGNRIEITE